MLGFPCEEMVEEDDNFYQHYICKPTPDTVGIVFRRHKGDRYKVTLYEFAGSPSAFRENRKRRRVDSREIDSLLAECPLTASTALFELVKRHNKTEQSDG